MVVGTGVPAYELGQRLQHKDSPLALRFFIDEEPWTHRTYLLNVQLRYPVEILPLVEKHGIKAILCTNATDAAHYSSTVGDALQQRDCRILLCESGTTAADLVAQLHTADS